MYKKIGLFFIVVSLIFVLFACNMQREQTNQEAEGLVFETQKIASVVFDTDDMYLDVSMDDWAEAWYEKEGELYEFVKGHKIIGLLYENEYYNFASYAEQYYKHDGDAEEALKHTDKLADEIVDDIVSWPIKEGIKVEGTISIEHNFRDSVVMQEINDIEFAEAEQKESKVNEIIIELSGWSMADNTILELENKGYEVIDRLEALNRLLILKPDIDSLNTAVKSLETYDGVQSAEPNIAVYTADYKEPTDERYDEQWAKPTMRLPQLWRDITGSKDIRVAIMDTGIYDANIELEEFVNRADGWDFAENNADTHAHHYHGTHVAGIASAKANYGKVAGVMWESELIPIKVFPDEHSSTDVYTIAKAMLYSAGFEVDGQRIEPVDVVNMSLGSREYSAILDDAVQQVAQNTDVIMVASSGNYSPLFPRSDVVYPAALDEVIAVGAVTNTGIDSSPERASFSCYGPELDVVAPGEQILSTVEADSVRYASGTSMSSPQVAGLVGLMLANNIEPNNVREVLHNTAIDLGEPGFDEEYGYGMVSAYWAVNNVSNIYIKIGDHEKTIDITERKFTINDIEPGEYEIKAWIDVRDNGIENGDYIATKQVVLEKEEHSINLTLKELHN